VALVACPECQSQVSDQAESCPRCGYPLKREREATKPAPPHPEPRVFLEDNPYYSEHGHWEHKLQPSPSAAGCEVG
jgi:predicted amidophosphoribosyltransferase